MPYHWKIKLFAGLPERLGQAEIDIQSSLEQMTAAELKRRITGMFPEHASIIQVSFVACNHAYASHEQMLHPSDELALLPPVSGGEEPNERNNERSDDPERRYVVTANKLAADEVLAKVIVPGHGAALAFTGTTREWTHGKRTVHLEYEAYEPMAIATMEQIGAEIAERWPGALCAISHRIGIVGLAETSVVIAVSTPHRESCYEASRYAIERLKQIVPIWKKEIWEDGSEWQGSQLGPWNPTLTVNEE